MSKIKKEIVYTNEDNQPFTFDNKSGEYMYFETTNGNSSLYFLSPEEVDEFIELLEEWKESTWKIRESTGSILKEKDGQDWPINNNEILDNYE